MLLAQAARGAGSRPTRISSLHPACFAHFEDGLRRTTVFDIKAAPRGLCDGTTRRDFLRVGALGSLGSFLPGSLSAAPRSIANSSGFGRAKRCLLLFLTGGPPQLDTWDLKPDAPAEIRGELRPIATTVPGLHISELFPRLAGQSDKYCILRSVTHQCTVHTPAGYAMLTGAEHPIINAKSATEIRPSPEDRPHVGSLLARFRPERSGVPTFATLPEIIKDDAVNEYPGQGGGFLGKLYDPLRIDADVANKTFRVPALSLPPGMTAARLQERRTLLPLLNGQLRQVESRGAFANLDSHYLQAYRLIGSPAVQRALELHHEPQRVREAYGPHLFGQGCLLARRLLEAGVSLVTVYWQYEGPHRRPTAPLPACWKTWPAAACSMTPWWCAWVNSDGRPVSIRAAAVSTGRSCNRLCLLVRGFPVARFMEHPIASGLTLQISLSHLPI